MDLHTEGSTGQSKGYGFVHFKQVRPRMPLHTRAPRALLCNALQRSATLCNALQLCVLCTTCAGCTL